MESSRESLVTVKTKQGNCNQRFWICDVVCGNLPYDGTNIVGPGQTPRVMRGVWPGPTIFVVAHEHLQQTFLCPSLCSVDHKYYHKRANKAYLEWHCFSIRQVFADDGTNTKKPKVLKGLTRSLPNSDRSSAVKQFGSGWDDEKPAVSSRSKLFGTLPIILQTIAMVCCI